MTERISVAAPMPRQIEICQRPRELGRPCLARIYRAQPGHIYCEKCGGHEAGAIYARRRRDTRETEAAK
jgi:hypothetical protein